MRAVQVTVEAEHLLAALRELTGRDERQALLRVDPEKATLSILDETPDSLCKLTLPLRALNGEGAAFSCRIQLHKWEPLTTLLERATGDLILTFRKTTLSVNLPGKQSFVIPNHLTTAPASVWEEQLHLAKGEFDPARVTRFTIPDSEPLRETLASCTENALLVRAGQGSVILHTEEFPADVRRPAETLWPRDVLLHRLAQLPAGTRLLARIIGGETPLILLTTVAAPVVCEILFKPYPSTRPTLTNITLRNERERPERPERIERVERKREKPAPPEEPLIVEIVPAERLPVIEEEAVAPEIAAPQPTREEILAQLDVLPGLTRIKKQIRDIAQFAAFEKERMEVLGVPGKRPTLHMAFLGNPGTGKTMVARMLGKLFKDLGLLTRGHVVEVDRQKLVGAYMGHTEANLTKYVKRAQGGILFIDEAYALYKKDSAKDFGNTAIHGLVKAMEDHRDNLVVIFAGYKREMHEFFSFNPGFRARVPFHLEFPDYTRDELLEIADYIAAQDLYQLTPDARDALIRATLREKIDDTFGNARTIRNLLEKAKIRHAVHVSATEGEPHPDAYTRLTAQDFGDDERDVETLEEVLGEFDGLVGLAEVKAMVMQMIDVLTLEQKRLVHGLEDQPLTLHMSFTGNPGTGKTTVARLIGRLMRALNLLPRGHFVEASRKDLVAGYMGQTALKTGDKIKEALGGVLFIDEAYALARRNREEFGAEALATLIKEMEDQKGLLAVILAGYTKEMAHLFQLNPGLKSRIRFHLHFPDYTATELVEIVKRKAVSAQYRLTPEAEERLWQVFLRACLQADVDFGNGRLAEQVFEQAKMRLSTRIGRMEDDADLETLMTITEEDIET
ncbi:MAG: AAA family ATPase [Tumebacillaceae bacterium]